jgi:glutamyl-tRNA synthetase
LHQALGNTLPVFAHIPFVTAPGTTKKLSKRDIGKYRENPKFKKMFDAADQVFPQIGLGSSETLNPVMVEYYERIGYLPEGVLNALSRLGWSLDDKTEFMSLDTVVENFTLERIVKNPAGLDPDKLFTFQAYWMNQLPPEKKLEGCLPYLVKAKIIAENPDDTMRSFVARLITAVGDRLKIFSDILDYPEYFVADDALPYDEKAFDKRVREAGVPEFLTKYRSLLETCEPFAAAELEQKTRAFVEETGIKIGTAVNAIRVAVTGKGTGPGLYDGLELLGRERSIARLDRALARI